MRISDWSSDVCSSDLCATELRRLRKRGMTPDPQVAVMINDLVCEGCGDCSRASNCLSVVPVETEFGRKRTVDLSTRSEEHTSELQSLMRISYAVFCLKKKKKAKQL